MAVTFNNVQTSAIINFLAASQSAVRSGVSRAAAKEGSSRQLAAGHAQKLSAFGFRRQEKRSFTDTQTRVTQYILRRLRLTQNVIIIGTTTTTIMWMCLVLTAAFAK